MGSTQQSLMAFSVKSNYVILVSVLMID